MEPFVVVSSITVEDHSVPCDVGGRDGARDVITTVPTKSHTQALTNRLLVVFSYKILCYTVLFL